MSTERNLLFGVLALQMSFVSREVLVHALSRWSECKDKPLGEMLLDENHITAERHAVINALVDEHVRAHDDDATKSLASVYLHADTMDELRSIQDPDVNHTLTAATLLESPSLTQTAPDRFASTVQSAGGRFRVLRAHAQGGLGKVSVAYDQQLNREVAFKEIREHHVHNPQSRSRFLREAEITGRLEHPCIVPVYALSHHDDGRPFYAMRFIQGETLEQAIRRYHEHESDPVELRKLLYCFLDVCNAIEHAHSRRVLHRDIKPDNVMLGEHGETLVVDWGLARPMGEVEEHAESDERFLQPALSGDSTDTVAGQAIGTPQFMSPEQAEGRHSELAAASDVFSLGATLYCLLTGKAPFEGRDVVEVLEKVKSAEFESPRKTNPRVPPALESICVKAMSLNPKDRYSSAQALKEDVERWLADEPVAAHQATFAERSRRWFRRHRTIVLIGVTVNLMVLLGFVIGFFVVSRQKQHVELARDTAEDARDSAAKARDAEASARGREQQRARQLRRQLYSTKVSLAEEKLQQNQFGLAGKFLDESDESRRGWEWRHLKRLHRAGRHPKNSLCTHKHQVMAVALSPNGKWVASGGQHGEVRVTEVDTGKTVRELTAEPLIPPALLRLLPKNDPKAMMARSFGTSVVMDLAFSPDGRYLAAAVSVVVVGELRVWDLRTGKVAFAMKQPKGGLVTVAYSPDGKQLVTGGWDPVIRFHDPITGKVVETIEGHTAPLLRARFSPDGRYLATGSFDRTARLWDAKTKKLVRKHDAGLHEIMSLAFSLDSQWLAAGDAEGKVKVWDVGSGKELHSLRAHLGFLFGLAFTEDRTRLITTGFDKRLRIWDLQTGELILTLAGHDDLISAVAMSSNGYVLATAGLDKTVRIWDATPLSDQEQRNPRTIAEHKSVVMDLDLNPNESEIVTAGLERIVKTWDCATGRQKITYRGHGPDAVIWSVKFSPDGRWIASADTRGGIRIWDAGTGKDRCICNAGQEHCVSLAWSPDGKDIAFGDGRQGIVTVWDVEQEKTVLKLEGDAIAAFAITYSPDGRYLATGGYGRMVKVWEAETGRLIKVIEWDVNIVQSLAFHPNGRLLAGAGENEAVKIWDVETGKEVKTLEAHNDRILSVSFSKDGKRLATASWDGTAKLWDVETGKALRTFYGQAGVAMRARFRAEGKELITASGYRAKGEVLLWDLRK